jgi:hypothetical protein
LNRSVLSHTPFAVQIAIAAAMLVLVVTFAAYALQPKMTVNYVPVTGPQAMPVTVPKMDLGAGYTLVTNAQGTSIIAPETIVKSASQSLDLGAGYILRDGEIMAPARPDTSVRRIDLGAGYTLETNAYNGQIVAPASAVKAQPTTSQTLDLGAGYTLRNGQIVAPASTMKVRPEASQKIDIGGGYWLVLTGNSGEIVH